MLTSGGSGFLSSPTITIEGGGATTSATASGFIDQENFTISNTHTGDIYLNGYKLLSGVDFTGDASEISLISSQIQNNNNQMLFAYDAIQVMVVSFKVDLLQTLSISVDYVDADGD